MNNVKIAEINAKLTERVNKTAENLKSEYSLLRVGKANAKILDKVTVEAYGDFVPLQQTANISSPDPRTLVITPWDKTLLGKIEKAVNAANLGLSPANDGNVIRIAFPPVTAERRAELVKQVKKLAEDARVSVRNARRDAFDAFKKLKTDKELSEDEHSAVEKDAEKLVHKLAEQIDVAEKDKEKEVTTI